MKQARKLNVVREVRMETESGFRKRRRWWLWMLKAFLVVVLVGGALVWGSHQVVRGWAILNARMETAYREAREKFTKVEVRRELVRPESIPLEQLVRAVSEKNRIPAVVLRAVVDQESSGGAHVYRFEPEKYNQLKKRERLSDSEIRMLASSHGVAHVMGFNAFPRCGVHWSRLYDTSVGLECGAKLLKENMDRHADVRDTSRRIWLALKDYNGAGPGAEAYANQVMAKVGALLLGELRAEL